MRKLPDGTPLQNSTQISGATPLDLRYPQLAIVRKLFYKDDSDSPDPNSMMAIIEITSNGMYVETPPVRFASGIKFGVENMLDVTPRSSKSTYNQTPYSDKSGDNDRTEETITDGDIVLVQFINGNPYNGIVTNFVSHGEASVNNLPSRDDGERFLLQHQGMRMGIDKNGDMTIESFKSELPEFKNGNPKRTCTVKMYDDNGKGVEVVVDNKTNSISLKAEDGKTSTMTLTKDGLTVTGDQLNVTTPTIGFTGSTKVEFTSPQVNLKGDKVDIGTGASKKAVIGEEILDFLKTFITLFNAHIHQVPQAPTGTLPSAPPIVQAQAPTTSIMSTTVKLKE